MILNTGAPSYKAILVFSGKLGSVAGPVIQANGRLSFEDDLRSGCLQTMTIAKHNQPIPKLFGNRPLASAAEVFCETISLVIYTRATINCS